MKKEIVVGVEVGCPYNQHCKGIDEEIEGQIDGRLRTTGYCVIERFIEWHCE